MTTDHNLNIEVPVKDSSLRNTETGTSSSSCSRTEFSNRHSDKSCLRSIGIEPVMLFHGIANSGMTIIVQNFYIDRICRVSNNLTNEICLNLTHNPMNEKLVETEASEFTMYQSLIEYGLPIILALFLGPWTDKYGNKPVILLSLFGYLLSSILYILVYNAPQLPPGYILISSIPIAISGGVVTFVISTYSFMMKQTDLKSRSFRLSVISITWDFGGTIGALTGAKIFELWGFLAVFGFSCVFYGTAFLYALTILTEEVPERFDLNGYESNYLCDIFDTSAVKDTIRTCFRRREGNRRMWILILMACISLQMISYCTKLFQYLFSRNEFGWDAEIFSEYSAASTLMSNIGGALMIFVFMKLLKLSDVIIAIINCTSNLCANLVFAFSSSGWQMYLGSGVQMFGSITTAVIRSMLSKCVTNDEHGRVLSFVTCVELSMPFIAGPLYGFVYMKTVLIFSGTFFLVAAALTIVMLGLLIFLSCSMKHQLTYAALVEA